MQLVVTGTDTVFKTKLFGRKVRDFNNSYMLITFTRSTQTLFTCKLRQGSAVMWESMLGKFHSDISVWRFVFRWCFSGVYGCCRTDFPQQYAMFCDFFFVIIKRIWLTLQPSREDCVLRLFFSQCPNVYPVGLAFRGFSLFLFLATCSFVPCRVIHLSAFPEAVYK